eukprot:TRINITY_DN6272_c6_g1_i1.p1 TRINITY_DN6272_c6_g1~~TRINITY_DN6272_c6_g1_i1.p1  ORF type:complete len:571 (-),score=17.98 TRINITY_DN6272_c6_g1_i1:156-1733(-)
MISAAARSSSRGARKALGSFAAARLLAPACPFTSSSAPAAAAAAAASTALSHAPAKKSGGLLSLLLGSAPPQGPSMVEPLPGVALPKALESFPASETQVSTLANGLKVASENLPGPTATVGVYVDSGSVYEHGGNSGASHLLERMAFKSTANRTHFRLIREIEAIGANVMSSASREQMAFTADVIRTFVPEAVELLADTVRNSLFQEWEVKEQVSKIRAELAQLQATNPQGLMLEALHSAGFAGALGHPLLAHDSSLARLDGQTLFDYVQTNFTAPRIVVAAAGVDHSELVAAVEPLFADMPKAALPDAPVSQYVGGDWRMAADSPVTHVALGFEFPGGWRNEKDALAAVVLQTLLGGGGSFSAGGPGKGMYSRLYTRVLNEHGEVQSCTAFNSIYNSTGLFGIHATAPSEFAPQLVDIVTKEFLAVAAPGGVTGEELQRAKTATVASVLMNLESRVVVAEDIGRQILTYGHRKAPRDFIDGLNAVTAADIAAVAKKIITTPLSMASYGDVVHVPRFDQVAARFG